MNAQSIFNNKFFVNFTKYTFLLTELTKRDIKVKYRRSILGIFWSFLEPLLFMIVLTIIFSTIFKGSIANYPVYLLVGRLVYSFFGQGTQGSLHSIYKNAAIIKKIYVPKYMYGLSAVLSSLITFLLSFIVLFMVMIATHAPFTWFILLSIVPLILLFFFTIGVGLILATLTVFFRDMEHLYTVFLTILMYGSAIMYPASIIPAKYQFLLTFNPFYAYVVLFRDCFLYGQWFDPFSIIFATISAIVAMIIGMTVFYKFQDKFILYI
ncbi:MAG: ABC transporter permease [Methanobacterium sp.]|uniref:ABC transporter permease n=1 Tax=Methanobacterium sp. TaxID=2164 RepID=UPI003C78E7D4